jgi:hypothetical protein
MTKEMFMTQIKGVMELADFADNLCQLCGSDSITPVDDSLATWVDGLIEGVNPHLDGDLTKDYFYEKFYECLNGRSEEGFKEYYEALVSGVADSKYITYYSR